MEFIEFANNKTLKIHNIEIACKNFTNEVSAIVRQVQEQNSVLKAENDRLKSEHYKDEEVQRLQQEVASWKKRVANGFEISEDECLAIREWKVRHAVEKHYSERFSYHFTPTPIGIVGQCVCDICGENYIFR